MKRIFTIALALFAALSMVACGKENDIEGESISPMETVTETQAEPKLEVLGEWVSIKDNTDKLLFRKGGTCVCIGNAIVSFTQDGLFGMETVPETGEIEKEENTYPYKWQADRIVTIEGPHSEVYEVFPDNGNVVMGIEGKAIFVRAEDYETYHAAYLAEAQKKVDQFCREGKEGRTELVFGTTYSITDKLNMTVHECVRGEIASKDGSYPLLLRATFSNVTDEIVFLRYGKYNKTIQEKSDLTFYAQTQQMNSNQVVVGFLGTGFSEIVLTGTDDDYTGTGVFRDAEVLGPHAEKDYYIKIPSEKMYIYNMYGELTETLSPKAYYTTFKFDKIEFFCHTQELAQSMHE